MKQTEKQDRLVSEIQNNNESVLKKLYQENYFKTQGFVLKNNGSAPQAKDIYQEAFIAVWQNIKNEKFVPKNETALQGYLYQIAKNKWIDYLRSNQYKKTTQISVDIKIENQEKVEEDEKVITQLKEVETLVGDKTNFY